MSPNVISFLCANVRSEMVVFSLSAVLSLPFPFTSCKLYNLPTTCCPAQFNLTGVLCQFLNIPLLRDSLNCTPVVTCAINAAMVIPKLTSSLVLSAFQTPASFQNYLYLGCDLGSHLKGIAPGSPNTH